MSDKPELDAQSGRTEKERTQRVLDAAAAMEPKTGPTCQCPRCGRLHRKMAFSRPDSINIEKILVRALEYAAATIEEQMTFSVVGGAVQSVAKEARDALAKYEALTDPSTSDAVHNTMARFFCGLDERRERERLARAFWRLECEKASRDEIAAGRAPPEKWADPWDESGCGVRQQKQYYEIADTALACLKEKTQP